MSTPARTLWGQGPVRLGHGQEQEEEAADGLRVARGVLSPAISQPSYLPRGPGKFTALPLAVTLGTLVWQIIKTKHTHSCFFPHLPWSPDCVLQSFFGLPPCLLQFLLTPEAARLIHRSLIKHSMSNWDCVLPEPGQCGGHLNGFQVAARPQIANPCLLFQGGRWGGENDGDPNKVFGSGHFI